MTRSGENYTPDIGSELGRNGQEFSVAMSQMRVVVVPSRAEVVEQILVWGAGERDYDMA